MNKKLLIYRIVLLCLILSLMVFIFIYSAQPSDTSHDASAGIATGIVDKVAPGVSENYEVFETIHLWIRKLFHVAEFALLSFFATLFISTFKMKQWHHALIAIGFSILYAISDEMHQYFVPGRGAALLDVGIDSIGAILGWAFALLTLSLYGHIQKKRKQKAVL